MHDKQAFSQGWPSIQTHRKDVLPILFKIIGLAVQNLRIALKKAVFALGFKKPSAITL